jgi:hemerythrin superfamily protein
VPNNSNEQMISPSGELAARGSTAIEILVNDHQIIKNLLNQLVGAANNSRKDTFDRLKTVLTVHNATEEIWFIPRLQSSLERSRNRSISSTKRRKQIP